MPARRSAARAIRSSSGLKRDGTAMASSRGSTAHVGNPPLRAVATACPRPRVEPLAIFLRPEDIGASSLSGPLQSARGPAGVLSRSHSWVRARRPPRAARCSACSGARTMTDRPGSGLSRGPPWRSAKGHQECLVGLASARVHEDVWPDATANRRHRRRLRGPASPREIVTRLPGARRLCARRSRAC